MQDFKDEDDYKLKDQPFYISSGVFEKNSDKLLFIKSVNKIQEDILDILKALDEIIAHGDKKHNDSDLIKNFYKLKKKRQRTLLKKVERVKNYQSKHKGKFTGCVEQVLINLVKGCVIGKNIRYSREKDNFTNDGYYKREKHLHYETFLFIIDALHLLNIIDSEIGNKEDGLQSIMRFTEQGEIIFKPIIHSKIRFNKEEEQALVILRDKIEDEKVIVPYVKTKHISEKINRIKKYNTKYEDSEIKVIYKENTTREPIELKIHFLEFLNNYWRNNSIDINDLNITIINYDKIKDKEEYYKELIKSLYIINKTILISYLYYYEPIIINYSYKLNNNYKYNYIKYYNSNILNYNFINYKDINYYYYSKSINHTIDFHVPLGGKKNLKGCDYSQLDSQDKDEIKCKILVNEINLLLKKKSLYRVYSRGSFSMHGRFYGGVWQNMSKKLRKHIYVNKSDSPYRSLDFSAMHILLSYHQKMIPYKDKPYILDGYGEDYKKIFKTVGLVGLNAKNIQEAIGASLEKFEENDICMTGREVHKYLKIFMKHHSGIKDCFCNDMGIKLMNIDSNIIDDCLYQLMTKQGIVVLPEHDELLCPSEKYDLVKKQMTDSYRAEIKRVLVRKNILGKSESLPEDIQPDLPPDKVH